MSAAVSSGKWFGTDGIRGRFGEPPMTVGVAWRVGAAVGTVLGAGGVVVIGRDTRESGPALETALVAGLRSRGVEPLGLGVRPTPAVAHAVRRFGAAAGIVVTASHNPFEDNGIKIFGPDGYKLPDPMEAEIEREIDAVAEPAGGGVGGPCGVEKGADDAYAEFARETMGTFSLQGFRLALDCGHGAAYRIAPEVLRGMGAEVFVSGDRPDGRNINLGCGAMHPEVAAAMVREHRCDLGISLDGDADRVIFTDGRGEVVGGDRILAACAIGLHRQGLLRGGTLVATVMSNLGLRAAMETRGLRLETTAVGDRHVIERIRAGGYSFGGENSGHLVFADHGTTGDGLVSALQVLRMIRESGSPLHELVAVMDEYPSRLLNLPVPSKPPLEEVAGLRDLMERATVEFGVHGRHLIRYSGTESKVRILVEHKDAAVCDRWVECFRAAIIGGIA
jgi:phosphoglucosamine mutase